MKLSALLQRVKFTLVQGSPDTEITAVAYDSRKAVPGCCFVCLTGYNFDGHDYLPNAVEAGAAAVVVSKSVEVPKGVAVIRVEDGRETLALISAAFFGEPSRELTTIGITGTKGKTTVSMMIASILREAGQKVGVIGTTGVFIDGERVPTDYATPTTPESYELQRLLRIMADAGCGYAVMEVSSQGLKLRRTAGITFDYGLFLNLSEDHIAPDQHADFAEYRFCKSLLFRQCRLGILNRDDESYGKMLEGSTCETESFGLYGPADLTAARRELTRGPGFLGSVFEARGLLDCSVRVNMPGLFSVYNALAAMHVCFRCGVPEAQILSGLLHTVVRGRTEILPGPEDFTVLIDYAHNALSMESLLVTLREYRPARLICVFGGGGNRVRKRHFDMGEIAAKYADLTVITMDNPRFERLEDINRHIREGLARYNGRYVEIADRGEAIRWCLRNAKPGDLVALIGKGHEEYQEVAGKKLPFSERQVVLDYYGIK